jgi:hypothetical protein
MGLARKLRRELNDRVLELEEFDLSGLKLEDFLRELGKVNDFLNGNSVASDSEYRRRVKDAEEIARRYFSGEKRIEDLVLPQVALEHQQNGERPSDIVYIGFIDSILYEVVEHSKGLSIRDSGFKGRKRLILNWNFNPAGRLRFVGYGTSDREEKDIIIGVYNVGLPLDWQTTHIMTYDIPHEMFQTYKLYGNIPSVSLYGRIMQWGHSAARKIVRGIENENVGNPYEFKYYQRSLLELRTTPHMDSLRTASTIFPYLSENNDEPNNGSLKVTYKQN